MEKILIFFLKIFVPDRVDGTGIVGLPDINKSAPDYLAFL